MNGLKQVLRATLATMLTVLVVTGCASKQPPEPARETQLGTLDRSARLAYDLGQYDQAVTLYHAVLDRALLEDEPLAIVTARYNLAASQLAVGEYEDALRQIDLADAERMRRSGPQDAALTLLRATVLYRLNRPVEASAVLDQILTSDSAAAPDVREAGLFLDGLMAAEARDTDRLSAAAAALGPAPPATNAADVLELRAWLDRLQGTTSRALKGFEQVVALRRAEGDYRGMNRALTSAADLAEDTGDPGLAAAYMLRAGRSAARLEQRDARKWLEHAVRLGRATGDTGLVEEAQAEIEQLPET